MVNRRLSLLFNIAVYLKLYKYNKKLEYNAENQNALLFSPRFYPLSSNSYRSDVFVRLSLQHTASSASEHTNPVQSPVV